MTKITVFIFLFLLLLNQVTQVNAQSASHPNIFLNQTEIDAIKQKIAANEEPWISGYNQLISDANAALSQNPLSVTTSGTNTGHDFVASDIDPTRADYGSAVTASRAIRNLALAYVLSDNTAYADKAAELIKSWAVNSNTFMTPSLTSSQSLIELGITMPAIIYGADLIWNYDSPNWTSSDKTTFQTWANNLGTSAMNSTITVCPGYCNNFENWRLVLVSSAGALSQNQTLMDYAFNRYKNIIDIQIGSDGRMNEEWVRTDGLSYSLYAIKAMQLTAEIARHNGMDLYNYNLPNGKGLELALDFIAPYSDDDGTKWRNAGFQQNSLFTGQETDLFELSYQFLQKPAYLSVINFWGPVMNDSRILGLTSLTHHYGAYPFQVYTVSGNTPTPLPPTSTPTPLPGGIYILNPIADAIVRGGSFATINYGSDDSLFIKLEPNIDYVREGFIKFDLSSISGNVTDAKIVLHPIEVGGIITNEIALVDDDSWGETTITWNNKPTISTVLTNWSPTLNTPVEIDVTSQVQTAIASDNLLSVKVYSLTSNNAIYARYGSRESLTPQNAPELIITVVTPSPTPSCDKVNGDADCNGSINLTDFIIWKSEFTNGGSLDSDFDGSNTVTLLDFIAWKNGFVNAGN